MTTEIYKPPYSYSAAEMGDSQMRIGFQGPPFSGKTTESLGWPNPIVLSYDRKTSAHTHRSDVIIVPFFDPAFIEKYQKRDGLQAPVNRKEALIKWLTLEGPKLQAEQTLILDGNTSIEEEYHIWFRFNESELASTKQGQIDGRVEWNMKKSYYEEIHSLLKSVKASVIFICHEQSERNDKGDLTGKFRPLLSGQSGDKFGGNLTDLFRCWAIAKPTDDAGKERLMKWAGIDKTELARWLTSTPASHSTLYIWQTQEDGICDCGTTSLRDCPKYILANYTEFCKYRKQQPNT